MSEGMSEIEKRLRERAYAVAAVSPVMSDDTARTAKVLVEAADTIASLTRKLEEAEEALGFYANKEAWDSGCGCCTNDSSDANPVMEEGERARTCLASIRLSRARGEEEGSSK